MAKGFGGIEGKAVKIIADTVELDKRYETQAAPSAALTPEEKTRVQNVVLSKLKSLMRRNSGS